MDPVIDYPELIDRLTSAFQYRYQEGTSGRFRFTGLIFARPQSHLAKSEIIPQIADWHCRSGEHIDFFFAGYTYPHPPIEGYEPVPVLGQQDWLYNPQKFNTFRQDIESRTTWKYSGACDLLLTNTFFDTAENKAAIDFSSMVLCQLDKMLEDKAISSIETFFETVFRFAESSTDLDPCWGFSDAQGWKIGVSSIRRALLSLLPKGITEDYLKAEHYVVRDVGLKKQSINV